MLEKQSNSLSSLRQQLIHADVSMVKTAILLTTHTSKNSLPSQGIKELTEAVTLR